MSYLSDQPEEEEEGVPVNCDDELCVSDCDCCSSLHNRPARASYIYISIKRDRDFNAVVRLQAQLFVFASHTSFFGRKRTKGASRDEVGPTRGKRVRGAETQS